MSFAQPPPTIDDVSNSELSGWLLRVLGRLVDVETLSDQQWDELAELYLRTNHTNEDVSTIDAILRGVPMYESAPVAAYPAPVYESAAYEAALPMQAVYPSNPVYAGANAYQDIVQAEDEDDDEDDEDDEDEDDEDEDDEDEDDGAEAEEEAVYEPNQY